MKGKEERKEGTQGKTRLGTDVDGEGMGLNCPSWHESQPLDPSHKGANEEAEQDGTGRDNGTGRERERGERTRPTEPTDGAHWAGEERQEEGREEGGEEGGVRVGALKIDQGSFMPMSEAH